MTNSRMEAARIADAMRLLRNMESIHPDMILSDAVKADLASQPAEPDRAEAVANEIADALAMAGYHDAADYVRSGYILELIGDALK